MTKCSKLKLSHKRQGRSQDFTKGGGGGHTVSNNIVMAFSPRNFVGCLLKKGLQVTGTPGPPLATPLSECFLFCSYRRIGGNFSSKACVLDNFDFLSQERIKYLVSFVILV